MRAGGVSQPTGMQGWYQQWLILQEMSSTQSSMPRALLRACIHLMNSCSTPNSYKEGKKEHWGSEESRDPGNGSSNGNSDWPPLESVRNQDKVHGAAWFSPDCPLQLGPSLLIRELGCSHSYFVFRPSLSHALLDDATRSCLFPEI